MNPQILIHFFLIAHAVSLLGIAGWYFGIIPHGVSERRFVWLGSYMLTSALLMVVTWLSSYYAPILVWLELFQFGGMVSALIFYYLAWRTIRSKTASSRWPWTLRAFTFLHLVGTHLIPLVLPIDQGTDGLLFSTGSGFGLLIVMVFSHLGFIRRQGHHLHWSMLAVVLLWLAIGILVIHDTYEVRLENLKSDLMDRTQSMVNLLEGRPEAITHADDDEISNLKKALQQVCADSEAVTNAFVIRVVDDVPQLLALGEDTAYPIRHDSLFPQAFLAILENNPVDHLFSASALMADGTEAWLSVAGIRDHDTDLLLGVLALVAPVDFLAGRATSTLFATELIVLIIALVIYASLAGFLQGHLRIKQRDALMDISFNVSQQMLKEKPIEDTAKWVVERLHDHLDLIYTSFWVCGDREGIHGFRPIYTAARQTTGTEWRPLSDLGEVWSKNLCNNKSIAGKLGRIGEPFPGAIPDGAPDHWVLAQSISYQNEPWGAIVTVFASRNHSTNRRLGTTLESIANAFTVALNREERSESLAAAEERFLTLIETSSDGFWDADHTKGVIHRSDRWWELLGYKDQTSLEEKPTWEEIVHPRDMVRVLSTQTKVAPFGRSRRRRLYRLLHNDGKWRWFESNMVEIRNAHGPVSRAIGFDRDVTDRMNYEKRLKESAEQAAKANRTKSKFLATVSHELRTPLNSIIGFSNLIQRTDLNIRQREWIESVSTSSELLLELISDLLDISRIEAGRLELNNAPFELLRLCEQVVENQSPIANKKEIALHLIFENGLTPAWVSGDSRRFRQIITNLVGNAVKFTDSGSVTLHVVKCEDARWKFEVIDSGPGIPPADIPNLFNRFYQVDNSTTRPQGGTGLGLAISQELALAMSGSIDVESEVGKGSIFTVTVALPSTDGPARRLTDNIETYPSNIFVLNGSDACLVELASILGETKCEIENLTTEEMLSENLGKEDKEIMVVVPQAFRPGAMQTAQTLRKNFEQRQTKLTLVATQCIQSIPDLFDVEFNTPPRRRDFISLLIGAPLRSPNQEAKAIRSLPSAPPFLKRLRVLAADDNALNRKVLGLMLSEIGIETEFADDGKIAIEKLSAAPYDFALIDIQMPFVDGFGVATWVKKKWHNLWKPPVLIAVSATSMDQMKEKCADVGLVDFISKPIDPENLETVICRHCPIEFGGPQINRINSRKNNRSPGSNRSPIQGNDTSNSYVDWKNFDSVWDLTNASEDPGVLENLLSNYRRESEETLSDIAQMEAADLPRARALLHKLKGSTGSLGFKAAFTCIARGSDEEGIRKFSEIVSGIPEIRIRTNQAFAEIKLRYPSLKIGNNSGQEDIHPLSSEEA